ncbi:hypothetical protein OG196_32010 [Kitasatospora purpeofusca]|uniref:hypothetical protein n=1 Tax=Kitasatospora purpeofusca TaxID=67352 RepID=UPI002E119845|nr:hypothetical protein OG196_32010 [Kitasatospora purpeofusca]
MTGDLAARLSAFAELFHPGPPTPYVLRRDVDVSGVSGTGTVAEGCYFSAAAGSVAVTRWRGKRGSTVAWDRARDVEAIHGHGGATRVVLLPVPTMFAVLTSVVSLGEQQEEGEWADGWNEALRTVRGLVEAGLGPYLQEGGATTGQPEKTLKSRYVTWANFVRGRYRQPGSAKPWPRRRR